MSHGIYIRRVFSSLAPASAIQFLFTCRVGRPLMLHVFLRPSSSPSIMRFFRSLPSDIVTPTNIHLSCWCDSLECRYLVKNNLLAPVFALFRENRGRDNLINSAVIELVEVSNPRDVLTGAKTTLYIHTRICLCARMSSATIAHLAVFASSKICMKRRPAAML